MKNEGGKYICDEFHVLSVHTQTHTPYLQIPSLHANMHTDTQTLNQANHKKKKPDSAS